MKVDPAHRITAKELLDNEWLTVSCSLTSVGTPSSRVGFHLALWFMCGLLTAVVWFQLLTT